MIDGYALSPEDWAHKLHYMTKAGFDDLYHASIGVTREGTVRGSQSDYRHGLRVGDQRSGVAARRTRAKSGGVSGGS